MHCITPHLGSSASTSPSALYFASSPFFRRSLNAPFPESSRTVSTEKGGRAAPFKDLLKKEGMLALFTDTDGKVRKEAQTLTVEIYRYLRDHGPSFQGTPSPLQGEGGGVDKSRSNVAFFVLRTAYPIDHSNSMRV